MGLLQVPPVYHWYEYGLVPPDPRAVSVIDCPLSMVGELGEMGIEESVEPLTVTRSTVEVALAVGLPAELSVTL